jgi:hypothetical protein
MRKITIIVFIGLFLGGFFPRTYAWSESTDYLPAFWPGGEMYPKAVIQETTHDFGEVRPGLHIKYDFKVENQGEAPLIIKRVTPG